MNKEETTKLIQEEFIKNVMTNLDSSLIFTYIQKLEQENQRLLELCMYALIRDTKIYNHELANDTKQAFMKIIKENINDDTYMLRCRILNYWNGDK